MGLNETTTITTTNDGVKIYPAKEFFLCDKCQLIDDLNRDYYLIIFESCDCCKLKFLNETSISEIFFVIRKWQPNVQKNINVFINMLLNKNCGINDRDGVTDMTILMYACRSGAAFIGDDEHVVDLLKMIVSKGADLNVKSNWLQMNCLHLCAFYDSHRCLEFLLNENCCVGINTPCESFNCGSALHISCMNKCFKSAHILIKHGANIDQVDNLGHKPFECLAKTEGSKDASKTVFQEHIENYLFENGNANSVDIKTTDSDLIKLNVTLKVSDYAKKELAKMKIKLDDQVIVSNRKIGYLRYCGPTKFANGTWAGVELIKPQGKHDGSLAGIRYFNCPKNHGIFCQLEKLKKFDPVKTQIPSIRYFTTSKIELPADNEIKLKRSHSQHSTAHSLQPVKILNNTPNKISTPTSHSSLLVPPSFKEPSKKTINLREESTSSIDGNLSENLENGMKVMYQGHRAVVRYVGNTHFAEGIWIGLELISQNGKNDGSIQGIRYFECDKRHGIFVRPNKLITNRK